MHAGQWWGLGGVMLLLAISGVDRLNAGDLETPYGADRGPLARLGSFLQHDGKNWRNASRHRPLAGWHAKNYYGFTQSSVPDLWDEMGDVVGDGELLDATADPKGLWSYGYPVGYSVGAACRPEWPFGPGPRCCLTPLHYELAAPTAFPAPRPPVAGVSWYGARSVPESFTKLGSTLSAAPLAGAPAIAPPPTPIESGPAAPPMH